MKAPLISICIPAYKHVQYLKRLLDSIVIQTFRDFEVIITDDSDDLSVKRLVELYNEKFTLLYLKNETALGMPSNWNRAIATGKGEWIKLMHDDDWFADAYSLQCFADQITQKAKFIASAYVNCYEDEQKKNYKISMSFSWKNRIITNPNVLFVKNVIGPPSTTLVHHSVRDVYNEHLRWRVDIEYYIRVLKYTHHIVYIERPLINIGISNLQVTNSCINNPSVELPEGYFLLKEYGIRQLRNIRIYDAWWRLLRNMNIKNEKELMQYEADEWPVTILRMVKDLSRVSKSLLKKGLISKACMLVSYFKNVFSTY